MRHSTYTGALMCNSSRGEKSEFSAALRGPPPGVLVEDSDYFRWLDSGRGKAGPLAAFGWYSPKYVEGLFYEVRSAPVQHISASLDENGDLPTFAASISSGQYIFSSYFVALGLCRSSAALVRVEPAA